MSATRHDKAEGEFPGQFLWGAALSAHASEGCNFHNDWWTWEQRPGRIRDGSTSRQAAWHLRYYPEDFALARKLGYNAHLFSLEWSRIEPEPGVFDEEALLHYENMLKALADNGLAPLCALQDVTLPRWFAEAGGWTQRRAPEHFARYVRAAAERLGPYCRRWIPIRRPMAQWRFGYMDGRWPPGGVAPWRWPRVFRNLFSGQALASAVLREQMPDAQIGLSIECQTHAPFDEESSWDFRSARREDHLWGGMAARGALEQRWPPMLNPRQDLAPDFLLATYAGSLTVRFHPFRLRRLWAEACDAESGETRPPWAEPSSHPAGLEAALGELARFGLPIIVTGCTWSGRDDAKRCTHLVNSLRALRGAMESGARVEGFLYEPFLDSFQWLQGLSQRNGLVYVDRDSLTRTPQNSAFLLKEIAQAGGIPPGAAKRFGA